MTDKMEPTIIPHIAIHLLELMYPVFTTKRNLIERNRESNLGEPEQSEVSV